jgi:hypothetical protein
MKAFFYMGRNANNVSGVSWKIWKIERQDRKVTTFWGPAALKGRRVTAKGKLNFKSLRFRNAELAREYEASRIKSKLSKGYERKPRSQK